MTRKRIVTSVIVCVLLLALILGSLFAYKMYQSNHRVVSVQPVANINWGYWGDTETSYGMVTNDSAQEIYIDDSVMIKDLYVAEGDVVEIGDPLISYDMTEVNISIARKKIEIDTTENDIALATNRLNNLKTANPVDKTPPQIDEAKLAELEEQDRIFNSIPEQDDTKEGIYNYVTADSIPNNAVVDLETGEIIYPAGTQEDPYIFFCKEDVFAYGDFYNAIRSSENSVGIYVEFYVGDLNGAKFALDGNLLPTNYDEDRMWYVFSGEERLPSALAEEYRDSFFQDTLDWEEPDGYTQQELVEEIAALEKELKVLDIQHRRQLLELKSLEQSSKDGVVYATVAGTVKTVGDKENPSSNGTAFLVVMGEDGLYVNGTISELLLEHVQIGMVVTANSWESGMTFEATITEISDFPVTGNSWGEGSPNVSYYSYTAYIEDKKKKKNGEYVDLSISINYSNEAGIFIEKAYRSEENGRSYGIYADENGKLKKQYVVTGKTVYGSAVEIKSGLTDADLIAFPYGKDAVEGAAVSESTDYYY